MLQSGEELSADLLALKAAIRTLSEAISQHYEDEIGLQGEIIRKSLAIIDNANIEVAAGRADEIRAHAKTVLQDLFR